MSRTGESKGWVRWRPFGSRVCVSTMYPRYMRGVWRQRRRKIVNRVFFSSPFYWKFYGAHFFVAASCSMNFHQNKSYFLFYFLVSFLLLFCPNRRWRNQINNNQKNAQRSECNLWIFHWTKTHCVRSEIVYFKIWYFEEDLCLRPFSWMLLIK